MGLTAILSNVTSAVIEAEKKAKSSKDIQTLDILRPGLRQDLYIGKLMVIPYNIMDDMEKVPLPILKGATLSLFNGEEASALESHRLAETEFDQLTPKDFSEYKDKVFRDEDGKLGCLCVFLPAFANPRDYSGFRFIKNPEKLEQLIRHLVFAAYFRPSLSSLFDILEENQLKLDAVNIEHEHMGSFADLKSETNAFPIMESGASKTASVSRKPMLRFAASEIDAIKEEVLDPSEQAVMDQLVESIVSKTSAYVEDPSDPRYVPKRFRKDMTNVCRKCGESLEGNTNEFYCDKCNMPIKKYAEEEVDASMMRFGEEGDEPEAIEDADRSAQIDGTVVSGPNADEDLIIAIANDAEDLVADKYLASGDSLDLVEEVDEGAYDKALEEAIYEVMESKKIPYHDAEEVAAKVKAYLASQFGETEELEEEDEVPDADVSRELDSYFGDTTVEEPEDTKTSSKVATIDFFGKCEKCGALTSVPPGAAPEGHAIMCADCKKTASKKQATPTSWSVDNTRNVPKTLPHETTEEQDEDKKFHTSISASSKISPEKASEYFDVVRSEPELPEEKDMVANGEPLKLSNDAEVKKQLMDTPFKGQDGLKRRHDYGEEGSREAIEPEDAEEAPSNPSEEEKGGPKMGGLKKKLNKEAITYQHPGEGLHLLDEDEEDVLLRPNKVEAPDIKLARFKKAFDWTAPGQVLRELLPGVYNQLQDQMHDQDDYFPVEESMNKMTEHEDEGTPERDEFNAEEKHTLTSPGLVSTESGGGTPLRSHERNIRGPFFMDQFYKIHADIPPAYLSIKSSKTASDASKVEAVENFLVGLTAEIASTLLAAFKVSNKPAFVGVPTEGVVDLKAGYTEMNTMLNTVSNPITAQLQALFNSISDSELSEAINEAWSQSAVWKDSGIKSFLYEVFVRIESVDTETMIVKYKFITSLKEKE